MGSTATQTTGLSPGQVVEGKYRVVSLLAEGGMGAVFHAVQEPLGRNVAIKTLKLEGGDEDLDVSLKRFFREAALCARLNHPNTVIVYDYGKLQDINSFFLVMEFLEGVSLRELINKHGRLNSTLTLHISIQIANSLADAHRTGVVHRDLKPPNIMLVRRGEDVHFVKVVDFGLVKDLNQRDEELTTKHTVIGSPLYMAPERFLYQNADSPKVDIYSLGIMIYEMLTGKAPFRRAEKATTHQVMMQHVHEPVPPMRSLVPDLYLPEGLEEIVLSCLAKKPEDRIESMDLLAKHLNSCLKNETGQGMSGQFPIAAAPSYNSGVHLDVAEITAPLALEEPTQMTPNAGFQRPLSNPSPHFPAQGSGQFVPSTLGAQVQPMMMPSTVPAASKGVSDSAPSLLPHFIALGALFFVLMSFFANYIIGFGVLVVVGVIGFVMWRNRDPEKGISLNPKSLVEEATRAAKTEAKTQALPTYNKGVQQLYQGNLQAALALFKAVHLSQGFAEGENQKEEPFLYVQMTMCAALLGWLREAEEYRQIARSKLGSSQIQLLLAEVLLAVRAGQFKVAHDLATAGWMEAQNALSPQIVRSLSIVTAFSMEQSGQSQSPDFHSLLQGAMPHNGATPGEYIYLGKDWPEMRGFLVRYGLTQG